MTKLKKMAIAYLRVSTQQQGETGRGLELQETTVGVFATCSGHEIIQTFSDVHTGMGETSISDRRGLRQAVETAKSNRCPIIVDTLDRFSRDFETMRKFVSDNGVKIISARENVGSSPAAILSTAARAQREGQLISQNTKTALQERKARGVLLGNRTNLKEAQAKGAARNRARADQQALDLAPIIMELRQSGKTTAQAIADGLNARGHRTARQQPWKAANIRRLLKKVDSEAELPVAIFYTADLRTEGYQGNPLWGAF